MCWELAIVCWKNNLFTRGTLGSNLKIHQGCIRPKKQHVPFAALKKKDFWIILENTEAIIYKQTWLKFQERRATPMCYVCKTISLGIHWTILKDWRQSKIDSSTHKTKKWKPSGPKMKKRWFFKFLNRSIRVKKLKLCIHPNFRIGFGVIIWFDQKNIGHTIKFKKLYIILNWVLPQIHHPEKD